MSAAGNQTPTRTRRASAPAGRPGVSRAAAGGFTLVEMLVVMFVIVLAIALSIPAIRSLTGTKSQQAAQNTISAFLARERAEAIGLEQPRGVLFYIDKATDRVTLAAVKISPWQTGDATSGTQAAMVYLDMVPDHDTMILPPGIRVWTILDAFAPQPPQATLSFSNPITKIDSYRYLGFNDESIYANGAGATMDKGIIGGVILFDGQGRLLVTQYGFRITDNGSTSTPLAATLYSKPTKGFKNWPVTGNTAYLRSQVGFVLAEREPLQNVQQGQPNPDGNTGGQATAVDTWLDNNTTPILVNFSNGTLTRAE